MPKFVRRWAAGEVACPFRPRPRRKGGKRAHRRRRTRERLVPALLPAELAPTPEQALIDDARVIPGERLRLIFVCCHPALAPDSRVALTLRLVCGLSVSEIARYAL